MPELVSASEYARRRGVSKMAVSKALAAGRITAIEQDGKRLIDVDKANIDWAARTDAAQQHRGSKKDFEKTQPLARESAAKGATPGAGKSSGPKTSDHGLGLSLLEEKTRTERLKARRQEIELEQLEGLSVSREAVVAALSAKLMSAAETLQGIPDRFAAVFAAETDAAVIHRLLSSEIRAAMAAISTVPDALH